MSNLLKTVSLYKPHVNISNYKKPAIKVIIIYLLIVLLCSCEASEAAEKTRVVNEFKTVSVIPPTQEDSEFFQAEYNKAEAPQYPWK